MTWQDALTHRDKFYRAIEAMKAAQSNDEPHAWFAAKDDAYDAIAWFKRLTMAEANRMAETIDIEYERYWGINSGHE